MEEISILLGKTLKSVRRDGNESITFLTDKDEEYKMYHQQDCCEGVAIEDIEGDLQDLVGAPILQASEETNKDNKPSECEESWTWTFYKLATINGYVTIRWLGTSNGYYSEGVDFVKL